MDVEALQIHLVSHVEGTATTFPPQPVLSKCMFFFQKRSANSAAAIGKKASNTNTYFETWLFIGVFLHISPPP